MNRATTATVNGRTFRPVTDEFFTVRGIVAGFLSSERRDETLADVARIYGVDIRRARQIAFHFRNRAERRDELEARLVWPVRGPLVESRVPANDYRESRV